MSKGSSSPKTAGSYLANVAFIRRVRQGPYAAYEKEAKRDEALLANHEKFLKTKMSVNTLVLLFKLFL